MSHQVVQAQRLSIYCTEGDRRGRRPLYEWLVDLALRRGLGGATVRRALSGFGRHRRLHDQHLLSIAGDLPVVLEIIDTTENIDAYLDAAGDGLRGYTFIRENVKWHKPE